MPEPLKNLYTETLIDNLSKTIKTHYADFNCRQFKRYIFNQHWPQLELLQRLRHVTQGLHQYLPTSYSQALNILKPVSINMNGFEFMFFPDYVALYGLEHYEESITALEYFTRYSTSEMAVRHFIIRYPKRMMTQMLRWSRSDNYHVRRLSSEGCRPRLPWSKALPEFKKDPTPIIKILERLKQDESEYVRRSVANNLNDIAKDHPDLVLKLATQWYGKHTDTDWLVKHGCRSLLKQGNTKALRLFGLKKPSHVTIQKFKVTKTVRLGDSLNFSFNLSTHKKILGKLRIEYAIGFLRANGTLSDKVFKISEAVYPDNTRAITKNHSFKVITTRRYYPGEQSIAIIINGHEFAKRKFTLS